MVRFRPGIVELDSRTMADCPAVRMDVSKRTTDVLGLTIYVLILYIAPPF